jgi:type I restriction enzyme R subunit
MTAASPTPTRGPEAKSPNFGFLAGTTPLLAQVGARAERYVFEDPATALIKLRQFGEMLAQEAAACSGLTIFPDEQQIDLLARLSNQQILTRELADLFHLLRKAGNKAVHEAAGSQRDALYGLQIARKLGVWFHRAFKDRTFKAGPFIPPPDPRLAEGALAEELDRLRQLVTEQQATVTVLRQTAEQEAAQRRKAEEDARRAYEDLGTSLDLAQETEAQAARDRAALQAHLAQLQAQMAAATPAQVAAVVEQAQAAGTALVLDEAETRKLIDAQLREAGWEADTVALCYKAGVRPAKGRNLAIAEWPTTSGPADYVLFTGLTPIAVVEAKRKAKDVVGAIEQSKRYSRNYLKKADELLPGGGPWDKYRVPFLFATNGRPFLQQLREKSGIWFLDARRSTNHPRPLEGWYTPGGLTDLLAQDLEQAEARLEAEPTDYLGLREYQNEAIRAVEQAIIDGKENLLLAMATGTGKTRTALGLMYRLIKAKRFRRVLFLVDRSALAEQAHNAFKDVKLENLQSFTEIYDVKGLGDLLPEPETRLHVATVQGMVKRVLYPNDKDIPVPVDWYDCVIVDECHRGYNLDKEMSEAELGFRSEDEYISTYRRILDHFDAVRIGLTATPALHTSEIFGPPVFHYTYRQAVIDGYLVDHRPPIRIITDLSEKGIHWGVNEPVGVYDARRNQVDLFRTPDEIDIEVDGFNTQVLTENFNRVVCRQLAAQIDPSLPGKTMVFCATDNHADTVVRLLKDAFDEVYGGVEDDAVVKITGAADKPLEKLRRYKNERLPKVAVTVDLLTTGIDVPEITNVVFIRRVRSRILYEQMLGRATRLCPEIGKEFFNVYDAVDLYSDMQAWTDMKPVVTRPNITFRQLADELGRVEFDYERRLVLEQFIAKFQRRKRRLKGEHEESFTTVTGMSPAAFVTFLKKQTKSPASVRAFLDARPSLPGFLDNLPTDGPRPILVSEHEDKFQRLETGYGTADKPEDYLEGFKKFLQENANLIPALVVVTQRPRDLTRKQLRELTLKLDEAGYNISALRTAWQELTNQDIAASLIGFIRQQALGSSLVPYHERVDKALKRVLTAQSWTPPQRTWLERIAKQIKVETVVDRDALDRGEFKTQGGFRRLNKVFDGKLEAVLQEMHEELWREQA